MPEKTAGKHKILLLIGFNNGALLILLNLTVGWQKIERRLKNLPNLSFALTMPSYDPLIPAEFSRDRTEKPQTQPDVQRMAQIRFVEFCKGLISPPLSNLVFIPK